MSEFHQRLNKAILGSGLTQDEISAKSGVSTKTIQNWTREADPTMPRLNQGVLVAIAIKKTAEFLITGKDIEYPGISPEALKIARAADELDNTGKEIVLEIVEGLKAKHPLGGSKSINTAG